MWKSKKITTPNGWKVGTDCHTSVRTGSQWREERNIAARSIPSGYREVRWASSRARIANRGIPIEMTLDSTANHSVNQGSFHEVVGFQHLRNLSFCRLYGFLPWNASVWHSHMVDFSIFIWTEVIRKPLKEVFFFMGIWYHRICNLQDAILHKSTNRNLFNV